MTDSIRPLPAAETAAAAPDRGAKSPFEEPKLAFIEPRLTPRGDLRDVTAGFFGDFSP